jgi:hypothetical protein
MKQVHAAHEIDYDRSKALRVLRDEIRNDTHRETQKQGLGRSASRNLVAGVAKDRVYAHARTRLHDLDDHAVSG